VRCTSLCVPPAAPRFESLCTSAPPLPRCPRARKPSVCYQSKSAELVVHLGALEITPSVNHPRLSSTLRCSHNHSLPDSWLCAALGSLGLLFFGSATCLSLTAANIQRRFASVISLPPSLLLDTRSQPFLSLGATRSSITYTVYGRKATRLPAVRFELALPNFS
jgi:hypothetical protein